MLKWFAMKSFYKSILKPILFKTNPEKIHDLFVSLGENLGKHAFTRNLISAFYEYKKNDVSKIVDGIKYKYPIILAAGFDYNGNLTQILDTLSFGGVEIGSITAGKCEGNDQPRMQRLPRNNAIIVNKGLRNDGIEKIVNRLKGKKSNLVQGISIARTNDEKSGKSIEAGIKDYCTSYETLIKNGVGDYYTINISCPNAFGGESFATPKALDKLLKSIASVRASHPNRKHKARLAPTDQPPKQQSNTQLYTQSYKPLYLKMPIMLPWLEFKELLDVAIEHKVNGVVIGNLNKNYDELKHRDEAPEKYQGGLSGEPCRKRSNDLIEKTNKEYRDKLTIIGCGGILTPDDAIDKFKLGADLVQLITGMIFEGPHLMKDICKKYSENRI